MNRCCLVAVTAVVLGPLIAAAAHAQPSSQQWRDPSPHRVKTVAVDGDVRLEVLDWGGTGRPMVLLGCYLSAHVYDEFAPKLTAQFHVYGLTRRGIGASDKPATGYDLQRSADDVLAVLDALKLDAPILLGTSCGGQVQTLLASQHPKRLGGLIYVDGATDPLMEPADPPMPDLATLPRQVAPMGELDMSSFAAYRAGLQRTRGFAFPEAELRAGFAVNPDGAMGRSLLDPAIRRAITVDARATPDYSRIRVPVLAIYQSQPPFANVARGYVVRTDQERAALRQLYDATRALYTRWQRQLLTAVPSARVVELPSANPFMFLTHEADVLREVRAFADAR